MNMIQNLLSHDPSLDAACRAFAIPDRVPASAQELELLSKGRRGSVTVGADDVVYWTFGKGPRILLAHGWCSRGSHLAAFVNPLLLRGFSVVIFDAPGHGDSCGLVSSIIHAGKAVLGLADQLGDMHGVIAHSAGSTAALWAFSNGLSVRCSVHLCGPSSLTQVVAGSARANGLNEEQSRLFREWAEEYTGVSLSSVDLPALSQALTHPGLIIHDADDRVVSISQSQALHHAWPKSKMISTTGLGHRRILSDKLTVESSIEYLSRNS